MKHLRSIGLALFLVMLMAGTALAQGFPPLKGSVADGTGRVTAGDVQAAADRLARVTTAKPIALAYNDAMGLDNETYGKRFLEANGFGNPDKANLDPKVILIAIDYQNRAIKVWYGDSFRSALDPTIQRIQETYIVANAAGDPTQAFVQGFDQIGAAINTHLNPPTPAPAVVNQTETKVDTTGIGNAAKSIFLIVLPIALVALALWLLFAYVIPWWKRKSAVLADIAAAKKGVIDTINNTWPRLPQNAHDNASMGLLLLTYQNEDEERARKLTEEYAAQQQAMLSIHERRQQYGRVPTYLLFTTIEDLKQLLANYQHLAGELEQVVAWLDAIDDEQAKVARKTAEAPANVADAKKALAAAADAYMAAAAASAHLPKLASDVTADLTHLAEMGDTELAANKPLTASRIADTLDQGVVAFTNAYSLIVEAETTLAAAYPTLTETIGARSAEIAKPAEILATPESELDKTITIFSGCEYAQAADMATALLAVCAGLLKAVKELVVALNKRDERYAGLAGLEALGYKLVVQADQTEVVQDLARANNALVKADHVKAGKWAQELDTDSERALETMLRLQKIHDSNLRRLSALAVNVAAAMKRRTSEVQPRWEELQRDFHRGNWEIVSPNFAQSGKLLDQLFDVPTDDNDLCSRIHTLNDFPCQDFLQAEDLMDQAEADLARAIQMLDELDAQYRKAVQAREQHDQVLSLAQAAFTAAVAKRDKDNRLIGPDVDRTLIEAQQAAARAVQADKDGIYVDVMAFSQQVRSLCDKATASMDKQVARIHELIERKENTKRQARAAIAALEQEIGQATAAAVQSDTRDSLSSATQHAAGANSDESRALSLEDEHMASALAEACSGYEAALEAAQSGRRSLQGDISSYNALLQKARSAVDSAQSAINSAASKCNDYRAGSAGDSDLARARSTLPSTPSSGTSRSALERAISDAASAERYADSAYREADDEIDDYEDRHRPVVTTSTSIGGSSSHSSFGGGGSSTTSHFGGGGSSSTSHF